jgi:hypothetical protein
MQSSTVDASWWTAAVIFVLGTAVYVSAWRRRSTPRRAT